MQPLQSSLPIPSPEMRPEALGGSKRHQRLVAAHKSLTCDTELMLRVSHQFAMIKRNRRPPICEEQVNIRCSSVKISPFFRGVERAGVFYSFLSIDFCRQTDLYLEQTGYGFSQIRGWTGDIKNYKTCTNLEKTIEVPFGFRVW